MNPADALPPVSAPNAAALPARVLQPEGALTAYTVGDWHRRFLAQLDGTGPLIIDLGRVTECDTLGLQLLCSARRTAREAACSFAVVRIPAAVADLARSVGLDSTLIHQGNAS